MTVKPVPTVIVEIYRAVLTVPPTVLSVMSMIELAVTFVLATVMVPALVHVYVPPVARTADDCGPPRKENAPPTTTGDVRICPGDWAKASSAVLPIKKAARTTMAIVPRNFINSFIVVFLLSAAERPDGERFRSPAGRSE